MNSLYYGDNLDILRKYIADESVDLIYLDPPFNSKRAYNVIFQDKTGLDSAAQIQAFEDTWTWTEETQKAFEEIMTGKYPAELKNMMKAFKEFMGINNLMAYLTMMAIRLVELHRVLKKTGSIYLHCDPTASHYLKILMDQIFGIRNYRNNIIWHYSGIKRPTARRFPQKYDDILFYVKDTATQKWNPQFIPHKEGYLKRWKKDRDGRFYRNDVNKTNGTMRTIYLDKLKGDLVDAVWGDIYKLNPVAKERISYPTQKPVALLERIVAASSNEGDVVLDPFCGCGTAIVAAEKLNRRWIGIDITHLAIALIKKRMSDHFPDSKFNIVGEPKSFYDAEQLFRQSAFQFEAWAVSLLSGQPYKSKGGGDKGVDGLIFFEDAKSNYHKIIISVKGGIYHPKDIRELKTVIDREKAPMGIMIALKPPTKGMLSETAAMGKWKMPGVDLEFPVMQIITIQELFDGKKPDIPLWHDTLKKASRERREREKTIKLL